MKRRHSQASCNDVELVRRILDGEHNFFRRLVERYESLVCHIVFPLVQHPQERQDVVQEVFVKIYQNLPGFRFQSRLSTWIGRIAYHHTLNTLRRKRQAQRVDLPEAELTPDSMEKQQADVVPGGRNGVHETLHPHHMLEQQELHSYLERGLQRLSPVQQTVIRLHHLDELSVAEIAQVLQLPENTVKSHLYRGRQRLKRFLESIYKGGELPV